LDFYRTRYIAIKMTIQIALFLRHRAFSPATILAW